MFGSRAEHFGLDWEWVEGELVDADAYWVAAAGTGHPHPRPVWGVWEANCLYLTVGSPTIRSALATDAAVTVHLGGSTDVVIVEGRSAGSSDDRGVVTAYNTKYDWDYAIADYGPFAVVEPKKVMAWRAAGPAGRDGFQQTGRWRFASGSA